MIQETGDGDGDGGGCMGEVEEMLGHVIDSKLYKHSKKSSLSEFEKTTGDFLLSFLHQVISHLIHDK